MGGEKRPGHRARDDGQKGAQFQDAVAPGKFFQRKKFRQQSVFGGAKDGAMDAHQKNGAQFHGQIFQTQTGRGKEHDAQLENLDGARDGAFAETVGQPSSQHRKKNEGRRKQSPHQRDERIALLRRQTEAAPQL